MLVIVALFTIESAAFGTGIGTRVDTWQLAVELLCTSRHP